MSIRPYSSSQELAEQLHSVVIHVLRRLRREDEPSGLNSPRLSALSVIVFGGPITLRDLAAVEQVRPPTMTKIVNALQEKGLITKKQNVEDGRSSYISATSGGKRLLLEARNRRIRSLVRQIDALGSTEREVLREAVRILAKLTTNIYRQSGNNSG